MEPIQLKLGENVARKKEELREKQVEEERWQKEREEKKRYFREHFKYGSTTVIKHKGEFFFWGDIAHCGKENIFHNARKIKSMMERNRMTLGHMDYDDPPTFYRGRFWEKEQRERRELYKDDLYKFSGDEIVVAELIDSEPIGHIYRDGLLMPQLRQYI
jgi:hypothetical protein